MEKAGPKTGRRYPHRNPSMPSEHSAPNRRLLALAFAALGFCAVALASCSTVEGMGEDLEYVGENMSEASRDAQD